MKYLSKIKDESPYESVLIESIVVRPEHRAIFAEAIDSLEGDLWHEAGKVGELDQRKLNAIEQIRLQYQLPTAKQIIEEPYFPY